MKSSEVVGVQLQQALNLRELIDTSMTTFQVVPPDSYDDLEGGQKNFVEDSDILDAIDFNFLKLSEEGDSSQTDFERLSSQMTDVTSCGKVRKQVVRPGEGSPVPENASVLIHYSAFFENWDEPFDSTYLRGKPDRFSLRSEAVIPGLLVSLKTMRKKEKARFLVHPDMAYGKMGCPPRIPPNAEVLFDVELLNFVEDLDLNPYEDDAKQEKTFEDYYKAAQILNLQGNDEFVRGNTKPAITKYRQATNMLEPVRLENKEEEDQWKKLLLRLYTNLSVCYNKDCQPYKVLDICKRAHGIGEDKKGKLLFNQGKALLTIGDFEPALKCLKKAQTLLPTNQAINDEIKKLQQLKKKFSDEEKTRITRAFGFQDPKVTECKSHPAENVTEGFATTVRNILDELKNGNNSCVVLPNGLTKEEEKYIMKEAKKLAMSVHMSNRGGQETLSIVKETSAHD